jgi:hypothetical protein
VTFRQAQGRLFDGGGSERGDVTGFTRLTGSLAAPIFTVTAACGRGSWQSCALNARTCVREGPSNPAKRSKRSDFALRVIRPDQPNRAFDIIREGMNDIKVFP